MNRKISYLKIYLFVFGLFNVFIVSTVPIIFGDLFLWKPRNIPTEIMMASLYFTMGIVMLFATRNPEGSKLFIDFLVIANIIHAVVMLIFIQNSIQLFLELSTTTYLFVIRLKK
jgi:hypothetical protein